MGIDTGMAFFGGFPGRRGLLGLAVIAVLAVGTTACTDENSDTGKVVSITDGDTLVASVNGKSQTIRLLNIDTPETKDPNKPVECLGTEATEFLSELLPVGAKIKLMYDVERTDKFDRTLAAVFTSDDVFVSAEIARAGLGTAVSFGPNTQFLPPVEAAEAEGKAAAKGIFDPLVECTLPAEITAATDALAQAAGVTAGSNAAGTGTVIALTELSVETAKALKTMLVAGNASTDMVRWAAFDEQGLASETKLLSTKIELAESNLQTLKQTESNQKKTEKAAAEAAAAKAKAKAEAKAKAKAKAVAEAKAQAAAKAAAEAEAERIRNLPPVYIPPAPVPYDPPVYQPPVQDSGGGGDVGYTGPRCYAPGGKTWRPC